MTPSKKSALSKFQHTAARRRLLLLRIVILVKLKFQHTAARRRLHPVVKMTEINTSFNTQPRGGGCSLHKKARKISRLNTVFR